MAFPYSDPFANNNKVDLELEPEIATVNKVVAQEWNDLTDGANALASALTAGEYLGLVGGASPAVAPAGGVHLKAGAAGLETSFDGGAYAPVAGSVPDAADGVAGKVNLVDQVLGAGGKTFKSFVGLQSDPAAAVSGSGEVRLRSNAGALEVSLSGGAYTTVTTGTGTLDTPQECFSSSGHITLSLAAHCNYYHTTSENTNLDAPTNALAGMAGVIEFLQGATPRTLTFSNAFWRFSGGIVPVLTPSTGAVDRLYYCVGHDGIADCRLASNVI